MSVYRTIGPLVFSFDSVLRPFQDYFSSYETGQSVGHTNMTLAVDHGYKALYHNNGYMSLRMTKPTILGPTRSDTNQPVQS